MVVGEPLRRAPVAHQPQAQCPAAVAQFVVLLGIGAGGVVGRLHIVPRPGGGAGLAQDVVWFLCQREGPHREVLPGWDDGALRAREEPPHAQFIEEPVDAVQCAALEVEGGLADLLLHGVAIGLPGQRALDGGQYMGSLGGIVEAGDEDGGTHRANRVSVTGDGRDIDARVPGLRAVSEHDRLAVVGNGIDDREVAARHPVEMLLQFLGREAYRHGSILHRNDDQLRHSAAGKDQLTLRRGVFEATDGLARRVACAS